MNQTIHRHYMLRALELAEQGCLTTSPNPMVGCVIVKNDQIVSEGFHQYAGGPHAEIIALQQAGQDAVGATAYVSLEPCCHIGKTPPCTNQIIQSGIKKVYTACVDPNPLVAGKGIECLRAANIEVEVGLCKSEAQKLNEIFFYYMQHKQPFVIAKWAMSLDGKTITQLSDSKKISSTASSQQTHQLRQRLDAILIGANTAREDNPLLTVRLNESQSLPHMNHPLRVVLSSQGKLPLHLSIFDSSLPGKTLVVTTAAVDRQWCQLMEQKNIEIMILPCNHQNQVDLKRLLIELGKRKITSLLVEGGMTVHHQFFAAQLVNQLQVYLAPVIIGTLKKKQPVTNIQLSPLENDFHFIAEFRNQRHV